MTKHEGELLDMLTRLLVWGKLRGIKGRPWEGALELHERMGNEAARDLELRLATELRKRANVEKVLDTDPTLLP